ncbi:hypothetical protein GCM10023143_31180 [Compostibacter hankyongensis]|uniref:T9SS type A sorting domain-containing protein n=2 Tax=Compostibacter hankyongensis TaxID=1007089 RepID=A0ABP8G6G6_9BACT
MCSLNSYYNSHNIYFLKTGYDEILLDTYANFTSSQTNALFNVNKKDSVVNVYLLPNDVADGAFGGIADNIPGTAMIMGYSNFVFTDATFPHEMGHVLGLYHTHHGIEPGGCPETSTNCTSCGDYICDTPPDPGLDGGNVNANCVYTGPTGYNPDVHNIMSYAPFDCRTELTDDQFIRMDGIISGNAYLQKCLLHPFISGPESFCTSGSYSITGLLSGMPVSWSATPTGNVSITPNGYNVTVNRIFDATVTLTATVSVNGCTIPLTRTIYSGATPIYISTIPNGQCSGTFQSYYLENSIPTSGTGWHWSVEYLGPNSQIFINSSNSPSTYVDVSGGGTVRLDYTDECGNAQSTSVTVYSPCHPLIIYPNPADDNITISLPGLGEQGINSKNLKLPSGNVFADSFDLKTINIYDLSGKMLLQKRITDNHSSQIQLNVSSLAPGVYIIELSNGNAAIRDKFVIQR